MTIWEEEGRGGKGKGGTHFEMHTAFVLEGLLARIFFCSVLFFSSINEKVNMKHCLGEEGLWSACSTEAQRCCHHFDSIAAQYSMWVQWWFVLTGGTSRFGHSKQGEGRNPPARLSSSALIT